MDRINPSDGEDDRFINEYTYLCLAIGKYNFWQSKVQLPVPPYLLHQ